MNFKTYLIKKKSIISLMVVNCFALAVNLLGVDYTWGSCSKNSQGYGDYRGHTATSHLFSRYDLTQNYHFDKPSEKFWLFVDFTEKQRFNRDCTVFLGIFNYFHYSEFIVYTLLIFLATYVSWEVKKLKPESTEEFLK